MKTLTTIQTIFLILICAFAFGFLSRLGAKTTDYIWPDKPWQLEYTIKNDIEE